MREAKENMDYVVGEDMRVGGLVRKDANNREHGESCYGACKSNPITFVFAEKRPQNACYCFVYWFLCEQSCLLVFALELIYAQQRLYSWMKKSTENNRLSILQWLTGTCCSIWNRITNK